MTSWRQAFGWILLLLVILGVVAFLVSTTGFVVPDLPTAIVGGALTLGLTYLFKRLGEIQAEQRQRKIEAYTGFMSMIFSDVVAPIHKRMASGAAPAAGSEDINDKLFEVSAQIGLWARNDVLKEYTTLLDGFMTGGKSGRPDEAFERIAEIILVFRKDLGYPPGNLTKRDLYPLFGVPRTLGLPSAQPLPIPTTPPSAPPPSAPPA